MVPPFLLPSNTGFTIDQPPLSSTSVEQTGQVFAIHNFLFYPKKRSENLKLQKISTTGKY
jgi:hypothetical protein